MSEQPSVEPEGKEGEEIEEFEVLPLPEAENVSSVDTTSVETTSVEITPAEPVSSSSTSSPILVAVSGAGETTYSTYKITPYPELDKLLNIKLNLTDVPSELHEDWNHIVEVIQQYIIECHTTQPVSHTYAIYNHC